VYPIDLTGETRGRSWAQGVESYARVLWWRVELGAIKCGVDSVVARDAPGE
jgi:hypothetical protein